MYFVCFSLQDEVKYALISASNDGEQFFLLETVSGIIRLRKPVESTYNEYTVSFHHNDSISFIRQHKS